MAVYLILVKDELTNIQIMAQNKKLGNSIWIRAAETKFRFWAELKEKLVACRSYKAPHCAPVLLQHVGGKERVKSEAPVSNSSNKLSKAWYCFMYYHRGRLYDFWKVETSLEHCLHDTATLTPNFCDTPHPMMRINSEVRLSITLVNLFLRLVLDPLRLHAQLCHPHPGEPRAQPGSANTSSVGTGTCECVRSALHQLLLMMMHVEQMVCLQYLFPNTQGGKDAFSGLGKTSKIHLQSLYGLFAPGSRHRVLNPSLGRLPDAYQARQHPEKRAVLMQYYGSTHKKEKGSKHTRQTKDARLTPPDVISCEGNCAAALIQGTIFCAQKSTVPDMWFRGQSQQEVPLAPWDWSDRYVKRPAEDWSPSGDSPLALRTAAWEAQTSLYHSCSHALVAVMLSGENLRTRIVYNSDNVFFHFSERGQYLWKMLPKKPGRYVEMNTIGDLDALGGIQRHPARACKTPTNAGLADVAQGKTYKIAHSVTADRQTGSFFQLESLPSSEVLFKRSKKSSSSALCDVLGIMDMGDANFTIVVLLRGSWQSAFCQVVPWVFPELPGTSKTQGSGAAGFCM
ncbi:hypothetical protein Anapl_01255 [Anas platyrhynchos]|uniref:Uncharacterized protein n=1 Tax=Anas platyrhynchos TaxID=8839 RepID=R0M0J6_ANAPL|nr:hypothetical protein Anapl_01255 [Anas platyrhynchos]